MLYDLSTVVALFVVVAALALVGAGVSLTLVALSLTQHHRARVARRQSIPTYYRHVLLAH